MAAMLSRPQCVNTHAGYIAGHFLWLTHCVLVIPYGDIELGYNMVGVAVAMVISTMHEKSCIDSHNARKFEFVIHTSRNHNDEIAEVSSSLIF